MPRATADLTSTKVFNLKTCPPDGYVEVRKLSYGQVLERRGLVAGLKVKAGNDSKDFEGELSMANEKVTLYEFRNCIVEHNLEDEHGKKLDLKNPLDIRTLDPKIGQEIEAYLDEFNNFNADQADEEGNSSTASGSTSSDQAAVEE